VSDSVDRPDFLDPEEYARQRFYRVVRREPDWAIGLLIPRAIGTLRSLASMNHGDQAQDRARDVLAEIDATVMAKGKEAGLWHD